MGTRTWLTTPAGQVPEDDRGAGERWVAGPALPEEPSVPGAYRGALLMLAVLVLVVALTLLLGPSLRSGVQDPSFDVGGDPTAPTGDPTTPAADPTATTGDPTDAPGQLPGEG